MSGRPGFYEEAKPSPEYLRPSSATGILPTNNEDETPDDDQFPFRRGGGEGSTTTVIQREHMFDKVVTPSDVGKLNRLVIPKQHAEKYFPLDSSTNEKGLLLNFEDRNGKPWRFRYSYWNSSQSYVMTKGWSRFVKEKKLDAGDIVSFQRGVGELGKDRLFIDWRRRPDAPPDFPSYNNIPTLSIPHQFSFHRSSVNPWSNTPPLYMPPPPPSRDQYSHYLHQSQFHHHHHPYAYSSNIVNGNPCPPGSIMYLRSIPGGGGGGGGGGVLGPQQMGLMAAQTQRAGPEMEQMVFESVPVVQGKAAAKRLRLFGVNMDCPISDESADECDHILSSTTLPTMHPHPPPFDHSPSSSSLRGLRPPNVDKGKGSMSLDLDI
ncbi:hypothetical protein DH2020_020402 [Rehmannia glutinosa]|uniref:TF-B3 domain-containing protein n=1 Tax=Rehmannia glutinosa TaxID=99300 RepID=A0ABR0WG61_REHGL